MGSWISRFMPKALLRAAAALAVLAGLFVAVNRFDTRPAPPAFDDGSLPPSSLADDNGAFWLLFLGEPETAGLAIEARRDTYRMWLGRLPRLERFSWMTPPQTKALGASVWQTLESLPFPKPPGRDWPEFVRAERRRLELLRARFDVLLRRFDVLLGCEKLADFGYRVEWDRPFALSSFLQAVTRLHAALRLLEAEDGRWPEAAGGLLAEFRLGERLMAAAQTMFFHNLGRAIIDISLDAMAGLMNLPGCPPETAETVLRSLPGPGQARFGLRHALVGEFLWVSERLERGDRWRQSELALRELVPGRPAEQARLSLDIMIGQRIGPENARRLRGSVFLLFLMKNRTRGYFRDALEWLLGLDAVPPYRWPPEMRNPPPFRSRKLWWLWNPSGRLLYDGLDPGRQKLAVERKYLTQALCDLVRISAEMRLPGGPTSGAGPVDGRLGAFAARDPFSGDAYGWDPEKGILFSVGVDGKRDGGDPATDLVLPVNLVPAGGLPGKGAARPPVDLAYK
jgi:hypothetical protein